MDCGSREDSEGPQGRQSGNLGGITTAAKKKQNTLSFFGSITNSRQMKRQHVFCFTGCGYHSHKKTILKLFLFYGKRSHCRQMGNILLFILFHRKGKIVLFFVPDCFVKVGLNWDQGQGEL